MRTLPRCANTRPILNDVTYAELSLLLGQVARLSEVISCGLDTGRLVARDSGQGSPCLDLARINAEVGKIFELPEKYLTHVSSWRRRWRARRWT